MKLACSSLCSCATIPVWRVWGLGFNEVTEIPSEKIKRLKVSAEKGNKFSFACLYGNVYVCQA